MFLICTIYSYLLLYFPFMVGCDEIVEVFASLKSSSDEHTTKDYVYFQDSTNTVRIHNDSRADEDDDFLSTWNKTNNLWLEYLQRLEGGHAKLAKRKWYSQQGYCRASHQHLLHDLLFDDARQQFVSSCSLRLLSILSASFHRFSRHNSLKTRSTDQLN